MKNSGVPVILGSDGVLKDVTEAEKFAEKVGYPVMLKASAGGGGRGMRLVKSQKELESAFSSAQAESKSAFNNDDLYLEKFVENPRHIEVQILADSQGNTIHLGERECTIQRRHQKLIEESPSVVIDDKLRNKLGTAAINAAKTVNYVGVGTVEFLIDKNLDYYFM
jgi:acetyl-CoA carboxylase biotin carboxylase subunit